MSRFLALVCLGLIGIGIALAMSPSPDPDDIPDDLERWIATDAPGEGTDRWTAANHDDHEWTVSLPDGRPRVVPRDFKAKVEPPLPFEIGGGMAEDGLADEMLSTKVPDGWIVGFDGGEYGGALWWFSADGKSRLKLAEAHVKALIPADSGLLALEGLAHLSLDEGRVLRVSRDEKGPWKAETFLDLKAAPQVALKLDDGKLLVATSDRLLRIDPATRAVETLLDQLFWGGLYPNSMIVTPAGVIYLGMRHGVARVEKKGDAYQLRWLLPNRAFDEMKPRFR